MIQVLVWLFAIAASVAVVASRVFWSVDSLGIAMTLVAIAVALVIAAASLWAKQRDREEQQRQKRGDQGRAEKAKREEQERAARAEEERLERIAKEEEEWRSRFQPEIYFWPDPKGERRFVWKYPGGWPGDREGAPHELTSDEWFWVVAEIPHSAPDWRPRPIPKSDAATAEGPFVYETDPDYGSAHKVVGRLVGVHGERNVLALSRSDAPLPGVCVKDKWIVHGEFCSHGCGRPKRELQSDFEEYRRKNKERGE